jgi:hypothetical protein
MVSTESRQLAEQTAARLVATGGGGRQRRGNWSGFVRCAAIFLFGAGALLGLGVAQDLFQNPQCTYRNRSVIRWGTDRPEAVVDGCVKCHPRSTGPAAAPAVLPGTKGEWTQFGLGVPVRTETFLAVRRQRLLRWEKTLEHPELRAFVCAVLGKTPRRESAPVLCAALPCDHVLRVTHVSNQVSARSGPTGAVARHRRAAGLRRERDVFRWS